MRIFALLWLTAALAGAQNKKPAVAPQPVEVYGASATPDSPSAKEERELETALSESGNSPIEYSRALERHIRKYPNSEHRAEMERVLAQAAVDMRDKRRILLYGVPAIDSGSRSPLLLDHVTRTLLDSEDKESSERALKYARMFADVISTQLKEQRESKEVGAGRGRRLDETEFALARALTYQARALGNLGRLDEAIDTANKGWDACPTLENARERARWLERAGKNKEALAAFAEALAINDERGPARNPAKDRKQLADLAKKANGEETAFASELLAAYDRVAAVQSARQKRLAEFDPNSGAKAPSDFTLSAVAGGNLAMSSLQGKVVVMDFWATWCGPCRAQHPLYEEVKKRFKDRKDVVFLAVNTDEDRTAVKPFLDAQKWSQQVYFDDGLATLLRVSSIPTTVVLDKQGMIVSRMNGFIPERFVDMLSQRIQDALQEN